MLVAYNMLIYQKCDQTVKLYKSIDIIETIIKKNNKNADVEDRNARDSIQEDNSGNVNSKEACINLPKINNHIIYNNPDSSSWEKAVIISRAGKEADKYKY